MIFVTGGTGFLGHFLIPALHGQGYSLRVLTRYPERHTWLQQYKGVEVVQGDLRDKERILDVMKGCKTVVHGAGLFSMWDHAGDFEATNVLGTQHVLEGAIQEQVGKFIYISTMAVIGTPIKDVIIDENHPAHPADRYQKSKLDGEKLVNDYFQKYGLSTVVLRAGAFYGPLGQYAFNRLFFTDPMRGIIMQMDGGNYLQFPVYIEDVAQGILLVLSDGRAGETYNISGDSISHREAFDIICQIGDIHYPRLNIPGWLGIGFSHILEFVSRLTKREPFYPIGLRSYVFNSWDVRSDKAKRELGFEPTSFREGVIRTLAWYHAGKPNTLSEMNYEHIDQGISKI